MANAPTLDPILQDCWRVFNSLNEYTWSELDSYMRVTGIQLAYWELEAIMQLARSKDREPVWQNMQL